MRVCVLLAAFDGEKYIKEQLDSIFQQSECDVIDVFVRDDCSRDGTSEVLKNYSLKKDALKVLEANSNTGKAGFNFYELIRYVPPDYDYYAFADQDDIWMPDKLASAVNLLKSSGSECYSCAVEAFWSDGRTSVLKQNPRQLPADAFFEAAGQGCTYVFTQAFFVRLQDFVRSHASEIAKFEFHDWLAYVLSRAWGSKWYFDPVPHMRYRQHDNNELGARGGWKSIANRLRKIRSGWYKDQIAIAANLYMSAGGRERAAIDVYEKCLRKDSSFGMAAVFYLLMYSRRRLPDRLVLVFSYFVRWI